MKFYLIVAKGKQQGFPIPITVDLFLIGNDKICQLRSKLPGIGSQHCALVRRDRKIFLRDMDSGELTLLNGDVVPGGQEYPCHAGDRIEVGPLEFMIQFREKPLSQRDLEEWAAKCLDIAADRELFDEDADEFHHSTNASDAAAHLWDKMQAQRGLVMGRLRIAKESGVTSVRFNDRYLVEDAEIAYVKKELCDHLHKPNLRILLDCKNVRRISTAGLSMFHEMERWFANHGSRMALCRVREELKPMLATMGLEKVPVFHDKRAALAENW